MIDYNQKSQKMVSRSSRMRNVNAKTSNLLSLGTNNVRNYNKELTSKAAKNGNDVVYHRSNCSYPKVNSYGWGGDWPGAGCGYWVSTAYLEGHKAYVYLDGQGNQAENCPRWPCLYAEKKIVYISDADVVWYGANAETDYEYIAINKYFNRPQNDHNWTIWEFFQVLSNTNG